MFPRYTGLSKVFDEYVAPWTANSTYRVVDAVCADTEVGRLELRDLLTSVCAAASEDGAGVIVECSSDVADAVAHSGHGFRIVEEFSFFEVGFTVLSRSDK